MEFLKDKYRLDGFYIVDDLFMLSERKVVTFCEGLIDRKLNIRFNCTGRVNTVTRKIAQLLKDAGCISIFYGLESGNQEILKTMSKKTTLDQIYSTVRLTREEGMYCEFGFMFGQPGENAQTLQDTVDCIQKISYGEFRAQKIFGCVPFPGSGLYEWCKENGRIKDDKDFYDRYISQDLFLDQIPINMTSLPDEELRALFLAANKNLSDFYIDRMATAWARFFGGEAEAMDGSRVGKPMAHVHSRTETTGSTYDTSGRT